MAKEEKKAEAIVEETAVQTEMSDEEVLATIPEDRLIKLMAKLKAEVKADMEAEAALKPAAVPVEGELDAKTKARYERLQASERERVKGKVRIKLFQDTDKYKDDVIVGVNGENTVIQRGKYVEVSKAVNDVLINAQKQTEMAAEHSKELQRQYEQKKENLE